MAEVEGIFFGESRVFAFPFMDLNGLAPNGLSQQASNQVPMQFGNEGHWNLYGLSAMRGVEAAGGVPNNTPINLQIVRQDTGEEFFRQSNQNIPLGAPLEHVAGKAGNPGYMSYAKLMPPGVKLIPYVAQLGAATPTGRTPLYVVAHAALVKNPTKQPAPGTDLGLATQFQIGSKEAQQSLYRGRYVWYHGVFNFSALDTLAINGTRDITVPIALKEYFFCDTILCRMVNAQLGPVSSLNPLQVEDEILMSLRDTANNAPWFTPNFAPVWTVAGSRAARYYHPPTCFVVRPAGNINLTLKNGPTSAINYRIEFSFGGVMVDMPGKAIRNLVEG
jgi:hypothetical protein